MKLDDNFDLDVNIDLLCGDSNFNPEISITDRKITTKTAKREFLKIGKIKNLEKIISSIPKQNECCHIISSGTYDFFDFIPVLSKLIGNKNIDFYASTWVMSREHVLELIQLFDTKVINQINILTGEYFIKRENSIYATLIDGITKRAQRFISFKNHAKILLLHNENNYLVVEGSANFTANPRVEQYVITNSIDVYNFHKSWMDEAFIKNEKRT